jgi:multimeric flavodoxin WrbA
MAEAVSKGVLQVTGCEALVKRVPETLPGEVLEKMGVLEFQKRQTHIQVATMDNLAEADAVIFGAPTRFGNMCGQMRQFLDASGTLWQKGSLIGKPGSVEPVPLRSMAVKKRPSSAFILHCCIMAWWWSGSLILLPVKWVSAK